jgi:alpha-glucosidase
MMERAGCDGWMADYAEALPFDAVMHLGESGEQYHNRFAVEWIKLQRELLEESATLGEVLVFSRSGLTQTPGAAIAVWQGDQVTSWDRFDGMQSALHGLLNGAYSGIAINHSDVGGYTTVPLVGPEYSRTLELHQRWTEMNAFTAILRTHEGNSPSGNVQVYSDPEAMAHFAEFARLYAALAPYRQELMEHSSQRGWPLVRPMALHYPDDEKAWTIVDQFMLGDQILVAPTLAPCADEKCRRELYLPEGRWIHAWSSTLHEAGKEGLSIGVDAPVGRPAVFYRAGFQWPDNI